MASPIQPDSCDFKIELDVAEQPEPVWRTTPGQCSGISLDGTEENGSTTIPSSATSPWNPSATAIKSEPDSPTDSSQGIKAEPVDHCETSDRCHHLQSVDKREEKVDIHCEYSTCDDSSSLPVHSWSAVNSGSSEPHSWNRISNTNLDSQTESVGTNSSSDVINTEAVAPNICSDVFKTEVVTDIMMTVQTCDSIRSDSISCRDTDVDRPAGDQQKQEPPWSMTEESPDQPSAVYSTVQPMSDSTSGSLLSVNTSHQLCSATSVIFSSSELPGTSMHGETLHTVLPVSSTPDSGQKEGEKNNRRHVCDVCSKAFTEACSLKTHKLIHTGLKPYVCDVCSQSFTQAGNLKTHKLIHSGQRPFVCDLCSKAFNRASHLKIHKLSHTGQKLFGCDICRKTFTTAGNLKNHKLIHTGQKPFACDVCSITFTRAGDLKKHKLIHTGQKPFTCDVCSKAFTNSGNFKRHKLIHSGRKRFVCDVCSKAYFQSCVLDRHKRLHTWERSYKCPHCDADFCISCHLQKHIRSVHVSGRPNLCDVCGEAFSQLAHLKQHKRTHTGEKPYMCPDCGKGFAQSNALKKHCMTHTGEKPHTCPYCPAAFARSYSLNRHIQKLH